MRKLTDHIVSGDQAVQLEVAVVDEPGAGGANHKYEVNLHGDSGWDLCGRDGRVNPDGSVDSTLCIIGFQNGPIKEAGVNGVTQEALLAIVIDRLRSFQAGQYSCRENAIALTHCEEALMWLQRRTVARINRGVEGTHQK
jgi:hypothetical protein